MRIQKPPGEKEVKPRGNKKEVMKSQLNGVHVIGRNRPFVFPFDGNLPRITKRIKTISQNFEKFPKSYECNDFPKKENDYILQIITSIDI